MIIATSIMVTDNKIEMQNQINAIDTWCKAGFEIVSCNFKDEIEMLKSIFVNIDFFILERSAIKTHGRPYPYIYDILQGLKGYDDQHCGIVNSDICFRNFSKDMVGELLDENKNRLIYLHRYDIEDINSIDTQYYFSGIDAFFFHKNNIDCFKDEGFLLGRPEWDHWMIYTAINNSIEPLEIKNSFCFHVKHIQRWTAQESTGLIIDKKNNSDINSSFSESYYEITNRVMSDLTKIRYIKNEDSSIDNMNINIIKSDDLIYDDSFCDIVRENMRRYSDKNIIFKIGLGYFKNGDFYRISDFHGDLSNGYIKNVTATKNCARETINLGNIIAYIDFKQLAAEINLKRFYLYPYGRASRIMMDCLLEYGISPIGIVDKDENIHGKMCGGYSINSPQILKNFNEYDNVLIVSNLYSKQIYDELAAFIPKEKLIII